MVIFTGNRALILSRTHPDFQKTDAMRSDAGRSHSIQIVRDSLPPILLVGATRIHTPIRNPDQAM